MNNIAILLLMRDEEQKKTELQSQKEQKHCINLGKFPHIYILCTRAALRNKNTHSSLHARAMFTFIILSRSMEKNSAKKKTLLKKMFWHQQCYGNV